MADAALAAAPIGDFASASPAVQRHAASPAPAAKAPPSVHRALAEPGRPLDAAVRRDLEPRFGRDFSQVRIHSGARAARSAAGIRASAYTMGRDIVFGPGRFAPDTRQGRHLLAHELAHVVQQGDGQNAALQRQVAPAPLDPVAAIKELLSYDIDDWAITDANAASAFSLFLSLTKPRQVALLSAEDGLYLQRLRENLGPFQLPMFETMLVLLEPELQRQKFLSDSAKGSGKSFGEVGAALSRLQKVEHELAVRNTGTGTRVGTKATHQPATCSPTNCTIYVQEVLAQTFAQQGRAADWAKVQKSIELNIAARDGTPGDVSGIDIQAALQSQLGWKGIYWSPDPKYAIPREELGGHHPTDPSKGIQSSESGATFKTATNEGTYYKDFGPRKGYPGVSISHRVTRYAPQQPNLPLKTGYPGPSTTKADTSLLAKLKKLPFGVLAAHGAVHMAIFSYGKVLEIHWDQGATSLRLYEETDLEKWSIGPRSGYHNWASGTIVAPADDVDTAFK